MNENITLKNIPNELKMNGLWCGWKLTDKGKVPFNLLTGQYAKSNDESTFSTYPTLLNNIHKYLKFDESGKQLGGVGLGVFRGYSAIDIDHCVDDGQLSEMALDIITYCNSYTEFSPSGTGIRIIFKTNIKVDKELYYINNHNLGLEIYISNNTSKFVSITGNKVSGDTINDVDITYILNKYMKRGQFNIDSALKKDEKLNKLWNKQAPGSHSDESETDMALMCKLAYYLHNDEQMMKQYFEMSPYYKSKDAEHKKKWSGEYAMETIREANKYIGTVSSNFPAKSKTFDLNDTGNAHRFIDMFGEDLRYNIDNQCWMIWNGKFWQYDIQEYVKNYIELLAEKMLFETNSINDMNERVRAIKNIEHLYSSAGKESMLKEARHIQGVPITNAELDSDPWLICTDSGIIDLKTSEIREYRREDYISMTTGCEIDTENEPVKFLKFISEIFADDDVVHYVHKALGYSMTDSTREQCFFILHGDGNNGKSLLLDVINNTLGSYGVTSKPQLLTETNFGTQNSEEIARLKGKRFCAVEEIKAGEKMDEQIVKSLTSGIGNQVARFLYKNSFEFPVRCKFWMATNYEPVIKGSDKGVWRRVVEIPVPTDFTGREDKDLRDKLLTELPQILGWMLKGLKLYMEEGLEKPKAVIKATNEYKEEMDIVQQWINEYCECKPSYFERANTLYDNFRAFCQRRDQRTNQTVFGRNLGKKYKKYNSGEGIVYIGLRLKQGASNLEKKVAYEQIEVDGNI